MITYKRKGHACRKLKPNLFITERKSDGTFNLRMGLFAWLIFSAICFVVVASPLFGAANHVVRIIVVNTQAEADNIIAELGKGRSFAFLAKERSVDEKSRDRFGEIESSAFDELDEPMKDAALRLREGEVSSVLKLTDNRLGIVLMVDMKHYISGARAFKSGDFKNARTNLLKHVEVNPDAVKARVFLGRIAEAENQTKEAEMNYKEALRFDPGREEAYLLLGALYLRMGQYQQAKEIYDEGVRHVPGSKAMVSGAKKADGRLVAARHEQQKKEDKKAVPAEPKKPDVVDEAVETPKTTKPKEELPAVVLSKDMPSNKAASTDKIDKKIHIRVIFTDKESDAQDILTEVKKGKSFAIFAKEKSVDEKTRETYGYLGEVSLESLHTSMQDVLSKLPEGQVSDVIKIDQNRYAIVHVTEAGLYMEAEKAFIDRDYIAAEAKLLKYIESNPDAVKARTMLGKIYEDRNEPSKAIAMYKEAISFSPKTVLIYERLARVYLFLGMYTNAKNVYIQGLRQVPSSPELAEGIEIANMLTIGEGERMP